MHETTLMTLPHYDCNPRLCTVKHVHQNQVRNIAGDQESQNPHWN